MKQQTPDNHAIYEENWEDWNDMKVFGPGSRFLRSIVGDQADKLKSKPDIKTVLDVGSGEGTITHLLAEKFPLAQVKGIDFSKKGVDSSNKRYCLKNLSYVHDESSEALNSKYDLVTCFEVLEHIDDWKSFLKRIADASNKYVLLSTPTGRMREFEVHVGHFRNFKRKEVETEMERLGFKTVNALYAGFPFYSPIYRDISNKRNTGANDFEKGKYTLKQKIVAQLIYISFRYFSTRRNFGDKFCALFEKK